MKLLRRAKECYFRPQLGIILALLRAALCNTMCLSFTIQGTLAYTHSGGRVDIALPWCNE